MLSADGPAVLVLDEIQKVLGWSETVTRLRDTDGWQHRPLHVLLLGSSHILVQRGLTESLAGRFEMIPVRHWSFAEMRRAFGFELEQCPYFGGYAGAAALIGDKRRWASYIRDPLIETTVSRDILLLTRVDKPALLRCLFELGSQYSGQILSYQKMLGQLHDAGNTTTLAHYLEVLYGAGLQKHSGKAARSRPSSPKLLALNNALVTALGERSFAEARKDHEYWSRLVETAVAAHLTDGVTDPRVRLFY